MESARTLLGWAPCFSWSLSRLGRRPSPSTRSRLPRLAAGDTLPGFSSWNLAEIPQIRQVAARDGAPITYRLYPGRSDRAVVLVHGSSGREFFHAQACPGIAGGGRHGLLDQSTGHGGSGTTNGDTSYKRQLDDDLVDFVKAAGLAGPQIHRTLAGFSSGGARAAHGERAQRRPLRRLSCYLTLHRPRRADLAAGQRWLGERGGAAPARLVRPRGAWLPWFQGLPVVRFATAAKSDENRTPVYSYRLLNRHCSSIATGVPKSPASSGDRDRRRIERRAVPGQPIPAAVRHAQSEGRRDGRAELRPYGHEHRRQGCAAVAFGGAWRAPSKPSASTFKVREDMFAGLDGDTAAFERAMKLIADTLALVPTMPKPSSGAAMAG